MKFFTRLGVVLPRLPEEIIKILRIRSCREDGLVYLERAFTHNFGDFFFYGNCTIIRIYGCEQGPHVLPIFVSSRLAFLELIWQMMWMENEKMKMDIKGNLLPRVTILNEFIVGCDALEKVHNFLLKNHRLRVAQTRHYDLEGCINDIRVRELKDKGYFHSFVEREDLIINSLPHEAEQRRKKWDLMNKFETERKQEDPNFLGSFQHF